MESKSELEVLDGREFRVQGNAYAFKPRKIPFDEIIVDGHSGYVSMQALHWLSRNNIPVFVLDWNGSLISSILPPTPIRKSALVAQIKAANDLKKKLTIARTFVQAKITRSLQILNWLGERYDIEREVQATKREVSKLGKASSIVGFFSVEAHVASKYWQAFRKALPEAVDFQGRTVMSRNTNAADCVNLSLNYGYGFLEGEIRKAINVVGLESSIGFLHTTAEYQTKTSLVFDLMEPYRWIIDLSVIQAFESHILNVSDFHFDNDDYEYRFQPDAKTRYRHLLRERFNDGVTYKGRVLKWETVIQQKTNELAKYLSGSRPELDFCEPAPILERMDSRAVRETILSMTQRDANERGIGRSTLHYLRKRARFREPFLVYSPVRNKIVTTRNFA